MGTRHKIEFRSCRTACEARGRGDLSGTWPRAVMSQLECLVGLSVKDSQMDRQTDKQMDQRLHMDIRLFSRFL